MDISKSVDNNIENIKNLFGNSNDLNSRIIKIHKKKVGYIFLESVSSDDKISDFLVKSLSKLNNKNTTFKNLFNELENNIFNSKLSTTSNLEDICTKLSSGFTCIFIDNENKAIIIETRSDLDRGVVESNSEEIIRGPKDSFTENHQKNIGLIRKRIKDNNLWFNNIEVGKRTKTTVSIGYIKDIVREENVKKIEQRIKKINTDGILDSGYIREFITGKNKCVFPRMISTERPDLVCGALLEGKIIILVENSPFALILPALLIDFLHTPEDYYQKSINVSLTRFFRFLSFVLTIITPAFYIAVTTWDQEVIPNELLISLSIQKAGVPFPTALELLMMIITFEILREADARVPNSTGASISIVGALILGQAAVEAGIVSPIVIIIVAFTSISGLLYTDIDFINGIRWWRLIFIFFSMILGLIGLVIAIIIFLIKLCSIEVLDTPYTLPVSPLYPRLLKDSIIRISKKFDKKRANFLTDNINRMEDKN